MFSKSKKTRRAKKFINKDYGWGLRRATLISSNDVERMAVESSRAQYIRNLNARPNEFGSYYRGTSKYLEPPYSVTSHTKGKQNIVKYSTITTLPSLVGETRFCDQSDITTTSSCQPDIDKERKFTCKCEHCSKPRWPAKVLAEKTTVFKPNVMTFSDQCTMTPKLVNADCGHSQSSLKIDSAISPFMMREIAVRDTDERISAPEKFCRPPTPILRRCTFPVDRHYTQRRASCDDFQDKTIHDCEHECMSQKMSPLQSLKRMFRSPQVCTRECPNIDSTTRFKNIYNEGISDMIASRLPVTAVDHGQPPKPMPKCSRACVMSKWPDKMSETYIPYSHKHDSKYHSDCKKLNYKKNCKWDKEAIYNVPDRQVMDSCQKPYKKVCEGKPVSPCRPCNRLPKKVLASERDIESFITKNQCNKCNKR